VPRDALQTPGVEQLVHRAQHVFDIDDQHHRAIVKQRPGGDVLHLAQSFIQRQHHQSALADKSFDRHAIDRIALADHHNLEGFAAALTGRTIQQLAGGDQPDMSAFVPEMLATFDLHDVLWLQIAHALDVRQRKGIGFLADLHHQTAHYRQGQRHFQMKATALARRLLQHHCTAQLPDHVLHRVEADATPRHFGDGVAQAETWQEQERQQFFFAQLRGSFGR